MKIGENKNFIYTDELGLIEAGENTDDAVERINRAEVEQEIKNKKLFTKLQKEFPNQKIERCGPFWVIKPE